jgi:hypothetical protein
MRQSKGKRVVNDKRVDNKGNQPIPPVIEPKQLPLAQPEEQGKYRDTAVSMRMQMQMVVMMV